MPTDTAKQADLALPKVTPAEQRRASKIYDLLLERHPDAHCELTYTKSHELLIATILSAQTTDVAVNKATPALFKKFPTPKAFANATPKEIEPYVASLGFFRNKAKAVHESMKAIVERHHGQVPDTMEELLQLRGVARKTANVVLGNAFGKNEGVVVDTHVARLAVRFGFAEEGATPQAIERRLMALFPRDTWCMLSHLLIFHGRRVSTARAYNLDELDGELAKYCSFAKATKAAKKKTSKPNKKKASKKKTTKKKVIKQR
ncbi:MAG: endonuclease III [Phycisphaerales bacterium]|nr:endonuclease III [Phycisphaerales bacterium]